MRGVPIPLWHNQFLTFAVADFGRFLEASLPMTGKLNLKDVWLKVLYKDDSSVPSEMEVQLPYGAHSVRLKVFTPADAPLRLVSSMLAASNASNYGSVCG